MFIKNGNEVNYEFFTQLMLYSLLQKRRDNEKTQHNCLQEVLYMKNESGNGFLTPTLFNVRNESENRPRSITYLITCCRLVLCNF